MILSYSYIYITYAEFLFAKVMPQICEMHYRDFYAKVS